jgi:hypothetical protein
MTNENLAVDKKAWAAADLGKALLDLGKDVMKQQGISEFVWRGKDKGGWGLVKEPAGGVTLRAKALGIGLTSLAVIGGLYNIGKYSVTAVDAIRIGDYSVIFGAGLGVIGGILTVYSGLLFAELVPVFMSTGAVGAVGGLLLAAGALIVALSVDSDWEKFVKMSFFSNDKDTRNLRPIDPEVWGEGESHWLGKVASPQTRVRKSGIFGDSCRWGVANQRRSMERLMSRFSVFTMASAEPYTSRIFSGSESGPSTVELSYSIHVEFQYLPPGASLRLEVGMRDEGNWVPIELHLLGPDLLNSGARKRSQVMRGCFAPPGKPGWVFIQSAPGKQPFAMRYSLRCTLTLEDGTSISCDHTIVKYEAVATSPGSIRASSTSWMEANPYPTFANTFENVVDSSSRG